MGVRARPVICGETVESLVAALRQAIEPFEAGEFGHGAVDSCGDLRAFGSPSGKERIQSTSAAGMTPPPLLHFEI
jgi:hypothetical protein